MFLFLAGGLGRQGLNSYLYVLALFVGIIAAFTWYLGYRRGFTTSRQQLAQPVADLPQASPPLTESDKKVPAPYDLLAEQSPLAQMLTDTRGIVLWVNPAFTNLSGYQPYDIIGKNINILRSEITPRKTYEALWQTITAGNVWTGSFENKRADGVLFHDYSVIAPIKDSYGNTIAFASWKQKRTPAEDPVETVRLLHEQLLASQRMAGVGILASAIAHDFNNILAAIMGYAEMIKLAPDGPNVSQDAQRLLAAASQGRDINRQLLAYARKETPNRIVGNLGRYVSEAASFLRATLPPSVSIEEHLGDTKACMLMDPLLIHQMLNHLGTIAAHTMRDHGGTLIFALDHLLADGKRVPDGYTGPSWLRLKVTDTGIGIPSEQIPDLLKPVSVGKSAAEGRDLGLSVIQSIVLLHAGQISIESELGKGTRFTIQFPVVTEFDAKQS